MIRTIFCLLLGLQTPGESAYSQGKWDTIVLTIKPIPPCPTCKRPLATIKETVSMLNHPPDRRKMENLLDGK